jgi:hypothetical protein
MTPITLFVMGVFCIKKGIGETKYKPIPKKVISNPHKLLQEEVFLAATTKTLNIG